MSQLAVCPVARLEVSGTECLRIASNFSFRASSFQSRCGNHSPLVGDGSVLFPRAAVAQKTTLTMSMTTFCALEVGLKTSFHPAVKTVGHQFFVSLPKNGTVRIPSFGGCRCGMGAFNHPRIHGVQRTNLGISTSVRKEPSPSRHSQSSQLQKVESHSQLGQSRVKVIYMYGSGLRTMR